MAQSKYSLKRKSLRWMAWGVTVLVVVALLRSFVVTSCYIPSSGMENSLLPGDRLLVSRWSYGLPLSFCSDKVHYLGYQVGHRGDIALFHHPAEDPARPISRRPLYIGRLVGLPGDTLLVDSLFNIHQARQFSPDCQQLYAYSPARDKQMNTLISRLSLSRNRLLAADTLRYIRSFSRYEFYLLQQAAAPDSLCWLHPLDEMASDSLLQPLVVPSKGSCIKVTPWNITLLRNTLVLHEHRRATIEHGYLCVEGIPVSACTFTQDYYWVCTNNPVNLSDSRLFGFVPHSHLTGRATRIWFSQQPGHGLFGGYRWNRIGTPVN